MSLAGSDLLARLLESTPAAVVVADLRGRVVLLNDAAQRLLGYGARDLGAGLHVADLYRRREDARRVSARLRARPEGVVPLDDMMDVTLRAANGDPVACRGALAFVHGRDGTPVATLGVFLDRREVTNLGDRLQDVTAQVEVVERRAAGISVAAAASHELSQPLTAALGQVEMLLLDPALAPATQDRVERVMDQLERMRRIVQDFTRTITQRSPPSRPEEER